MTATRRMCVLAVVALGLCAGSTGRAEDTAAHHAFARVTVGSAITGPVSGRLLIFAKRETAAGAPQDKTADKESVDKVDINEFQPTESSVAAVDSDMVQPGSAVEVDLDQAAFPAAFATLPAGDYRLQAVLDVDHTYNYGGRGPQD